MSNSILWYATRGAGAVSTILLTAVVALGIATAMGWKPAGWPRFLTAGLHRNLALLALSFLGLHIVTAIVDPFTALGLNAALIPFSSPYRRIWLGLGVVAADLMLAVVVTSLVRGLLGYRSWRLVHWLAYAAWPVAVIHGIGGSDTRFAWMLAINGICVATIGTLLAWRLSQPGHGARARLALEGSTL